MEQFKSQKVLGHSDKPNLWFINYYAFFIAFPCIDLLGFSITLYFFLFLIYFKGRLLLDALSQSFKMKTVLFLFLFGAFWSTFFGPHFERSPTIISDLTVFVQYVYWILMAIFFIVYSKQLNLLELSKYIFLGLIISYIFFYFLPEIKFKTALIGMNTKPNRNALIYSSLALIPFSFYYISFKWKKSISIIFLFIFAAAVTMTGGRSGTILIALEILVIIQILFPISKILVKGLLIFVACLSFLSSSPIFEPVLAVIADKMKTINPRLSNLIRGEGDGDLTQDRSWLIRLVMVEKAQEINEKYPIFGIGLNHFKSYDAELYSLTKYNRLMGKSKVMFNQTSPHNSYYMLLAENGFWGLICVAILAFLPILNLVFKIFVNLPIHNSDLIIVGLLGISIHWYSIASFIGGVTWLVLGLSISAFKNKY